MREVSIPTIYDMTIDDRRPVTQEDVDRLLEIENAFGAVVQQMKVATSIVDRLRQKHSHKTNE